jgi:hypothetical protein
LLRNLTESSGVNLWVLVGDLAKQFRASQAAIRKDLDILQAMKNQFDFGRSRISLSPPAFKQLAGDETPVNSLSF